MVDQYHTLISVNQLAQQIQDPNLVLLDCRYALTDHTKGRSDYLAGHIPGAYFMDIGHDLSSAVIPGITGRHPLPHPEVLTATLRAAGVNPESQVVAYDQSNGAYASRAWWLLRWLGHENVAVLNGGFAEWQKNKLPLDIQWTAPRQGQFKSKLKMDMLIDVHQLARSNENIIDSRDYKRFTGELEPIDPIAGHIPGANCIPYLDNTDEFGNWRDEEFLKNKFANIIPTETHPPVFYCGSGITACHNILAYKIATQQEAKLYAGSWSEWIHYYPAATGT
jgi:thiosulfate/3-mercaptopyruvate sulfurtransferase